MKYCRFFIYTVLLFLLLFQQAFSEEAEPVKQQIIEEKIKLVEGDKTLADETKTHLLELYSKTLEFLDLITTHKQQSQNYQTSSKSAPGDIKLLEKKLEKIDSTKEQGKSQERQIKKLQALSLTELEQTLNSQSAKLAALETKNSELGQTLATENDTEIRKRLIESSQTLEQLLEDKKLSPAAEASVQKQARQWLLDSHIAAIRSEIKMLDQQLLSQPVRLKLQKLKKELSEHELKLFTAQIRLLEQQLDLKRSAEIKKTQELTRKEQIKAQGKHDLILSLAKLNSQLSEQISNTSRQLGILEASDDEINKETKRLVEEMASTRKKLEIAGLNQILGQILLKQKKALPNSKQYQKNMKNRERLVAQSTLQDIQYQEEYKKIKQKKEYFSQLTKEIDAELQVQLQDDLLALIKTRKELLKKAIKIDESYLKAIGELNFAEQKLIDVADNYMELLNKHLFWLRNANLFNLDDIKNIPQQIAFILSPTKWLAFTNDFFQMISHSFTIFIAVLFVAFLLLAQSRIKVLLINTGKKTRQIRSDSLLHSIKAIFYALLLAIPLPALLLLSSWQFSRIAETSEFTHSVVIAMKLIVMPLFSLQLFRYICLPGGLAEVHFKWSTSLVNGLRKEMNRLTLTLLPALFITAVLISIGESIIISGLGRISLLITLLTFAVFFYRLLKPDSGFLHTVAQKNSDGVFARYQILWFFLSLLLVTLLMGLTIMGYVYTAGQLTTSLIYTVWLIFALVIMQQLSVRWLLLTQRRFALKLAYEKRQAAQALRTVQNEDEAQDKEHVIDFDEPEIDMLSLSEQSSKLLDFVLFIIGIIGLGAIWIEVLPALAIFDKVQLWHYSGIIDGSEKLLPITLSDLILALLVAIITIIGGKRFPAIIEILLLQSSSISTGSRYTITTLANYGIIGVGFFTVFNILGANWAQFQWLFAALSVGIGFGLQEIVANFISGLIILIERPIRVGDFVSVGDNEGVVSRIQIRATTILTKDRKELLVPNKEFITGQLLNWSLSDPVARLIIPVGVAYGSDVAKAKELLLEIARENKSVLDEPKPRIIFFNFGDNTLDLQLRCFIADVDYRLKVTSELNEAINEKFTAADINIAFPQRDVHLDISQPVDIRVLS